MPTVGICARSSCAIASRLPAPRSRSTRSRSSSAPPRPPSSIGEYDSAVELGRRAIAGVDARVDPERAASLLERQRWYFWVAGDLAAAAAALAEANRLVPLQPPSAARAHILAHTAGVQMSAGRFADSLPIAEEALDVARAVGSRADEALALGILGTDLALLGRVDDGIERFREGLAIAEDLGGVEGIALGTANLATLLDRVGRTAEALDVATAGWERARAIGVERTYGGLLLAVAAKAAIALGRWDEADGLLALGLARDPVGTPGHPVADPARPTRHDARRSLAGRGCPRRGRRCR